MTAIQTAAGAITPPPNDKAVDENFYVSVINQLERWLANNEPSAQLRLALLRISQTAFAAAAGGEHGQQ
jgi:hypothetical protein